jgi:bacillithiol system protein YtxJ
MNIVFIKTQEELEQALLEEVSVIFKHSTRCPVSASAKREFETFALENNNIAGMYIIDVIKNRNIALDVASKTGIRHESPQILIVHFGHVIWNASHWSITAEAIQNGMQKK